MGSLRRGLALADATVCLLDRLGREVGGLVSELGSAGIGRLHALQLSGDRRQPLGDLAQAAHRTPSRSRTIAPSTPVTKPGASAPQYSLAISIASSIATSAGTSALCSIS